MIATGAGRLLEGPPLDDGAESLAAHRARLGGLSGGGARLISELEHSGLRGRGGAGYPTWRKWAAVRDRADRGPVVIANGAETEPLSGKDQVLMRCRPHLVIDGLLLAAETVCARRAVIHVTEAAALDSLAAALRERKAAGPPAVPIKVVRAPHRYVAGEESAVVAHLNGGAPRPTLVPPRVFERGVEGRPTLVQNVETLAHAALIARLGAEWFCSLGRGGAPGTMLVTIAGAVHTAGVREVPAGSTLAEVVATASGANRSVAALLVGGYFGRWIAASEAWDLRIGVDVPAGAGVVAVYPHGACAVTQLAALMTFLARESAKQCGPCEHGLASLATTSVELGAGSAKPGDPGRLTRWIGQIAGRGACHHPDGALMLLESGLRVFAGEVASHLRRGGCDRDRTLVLPAPDWSSRRR